MKDWVILDQARLNQRREKEIRGVRINVFLSPYDIPQAIRGQYDQQIGQFLIEFKYMEDEPIVRDQKDLALVLRIGKNSGRLFGIEVDVDKLKASHVNLAMYLQNMVSQALHKRLEQLPSGSSTHRNYDLASDIIKERQADLFGELQLAAT